MESVDYLKILKSRWKVVGAFVVVAVIAVYFTSPKSASKAFAAENVLLLDQTGIDEGGSRSVTNPATVGFLATAPEVAQRAAEKLGYTGDPQDIADATDVVPDVDIGTLTVTAEGATAQEAIDRVNVVAEQLIGLINEREEARVAGEVEDATALVQPLEARIEDLNNRLRADPENVQLSAEYQAAVNDRAEMEDPAEVAAQARTVWATVKPAVSASEQASFVAGFGPAQRAMIAGVFAFFLGFGVALMLDRSDSRLRTKEQVERRFGLPVLAEVPMLALRDRSRAAVVAFEREPRVAEAYRGLRTALLLFRSRIEERYAHTTNGNGHTSHSSSLTNGHGSSSSSAASPSSVRQLVVVTSPEAGDGKSTSTANLAMAYAEAGQSVLLVSWDLWRPLSPGVFDAQEGPGVADYLEGNGASLVRYVQDTSIPGVRIVTAGLGGHHPYTQIENARRLLEEARTLANIVIVDTAPILSASVTRELVTLADAVVVVCRSGRTTGAVADRCAELLERLGAPALGVVLVGVPTGPFADYYGSPPKGRGPLERAGFRRRSEEVGSGGGRHKASSGAAARPTSAQYRSK